MKTFVKMSEQKQN